MLEGNTMRMILAFFAIFVLAGVVILAGMLLSGGADSFWSFFSWLKISGSSANI